MKHYIFQKKHVGGMIHPIPPTNRTLRIMIYVLILIISGIYTVKTYLNRSTHF